MTLYIINCVAITDLDFLEEHPEVGFEINSEGSKNIAIVSEKYGAKLILNGVDPINSTGSGIVATNDNAGGGVSFLSAIIPNGHTYRLDLTGSSWQMNGWMELR